jgi:2-oxoglutarate ferredoxin oxidoreductase subunit delta
MAERSAPEARSETEHARRPRRKAAGVHIDPELCKVCGICVALCPQDVFDSDGRDVPVVARLEACTACRFCELHCPDFAIEVEAAPAPAEKAAEVDAGQAAVPGEAAAPGDAVAPDLEEATS